MLTVTVICPKCGTEVTVDAAAACCSECGKTVKRGEYATVRGKIVCHRCLFPGAAVGPTETKGGE